MFVVCYFEFFNGNLELDWFFNDIKMFKFSWNQHQIPKQKINVCVDWYFEISKAYRDWFFDINKFECSWNLHQLLKLKFL